MNAFTSLSRTCVAAMAAGFTLACTFDVPAQGIPLPVIPKATFSITNYGAVGDARTMNTPPFKNDRCGFRCRRGHGAGSGREIPDQAIYARQ